MNSHNFCHIFIRAPQKTKKKKKTAKKDGGGDTAKVPKVNKMTEVILINATVKSQTFSNPGPKCPITDSTLSDTGCALLCVQVASLSDDLPLHSNNKKARGRVIKTQKVFSTGKITAG